MQGIRYVQLLNKAINGNSENSRHDYTSSENVNVIVKCVAQTPDALGYFGLSYYKRLSFYINDKSLNSSPDLQKFTTFAVRNGLQLANKAGFVPLPSSTYQLVESKLYKRVTGSSFSGKIPVNISIGDALRISFDAHKMPQYR